MADSVSQEEIKRQYRVLEQTIDLQSQLRSKFKRNGVIAEIILLTASVLFATTTFGAVEFFDGLGIDDEFSGNILKFASVAAFLASLLLLVLDWNGKAAKHDDAVRRLSPVLKEFRESRRGDIWEESHLDRLSETYWQTSDDIEPIPPNKFNKLKSRYLLKKEISILLDKHAGCPRFILWICVILRDTYNALRHFDWKRNEK